MKKFIISAVLLMLGYSALAQRHLDTYTTINIVGGERFSNFIFHNSENVKSKDLGYVMHNAFGVNAEIYASRNIVRPEVMFYQAGAKTKFNGLDLNWRTSYLALHVDYMYAAFENNLFALKPGLGIGAAYMLTGEQTIGASRVNIVKEKSLKRFDMEAMGLLNSTFRINPILSIGVEYRFGFGLMQIEGDLDQKTRNISHSLLVNVGFTLGSGFSPRY